jgi:hypothetical protein
MGDVPEGLDGSGVGWRGEGSRFESGPSHARDAEEGDPGAERDGQDTNTHDMELHWCWSQIRLMSGLGLYCNWFTGEAFKCHMHCTATGSRMRLEMSHALTETVSEVRLHMPHALYCNGIHT